VSDYDLLREYAPGSKPREQDHHEGDGHDHDHIAVARAIQHGRPDTLGASAAAHLQRTAGNAATSALVAQREDDPAADPVRNVIGSGGGTGLDTSTRKTMESRFGQDFSSVKVHSGGPANEAAQSVQAHAFTVGNDIVFGATKNPSDEHTLAHELTHVVQQREGDVPGESIGNGMKVSDPGDWAEQQAEATANAVTSGGGSEHASADHGGAGEGGSVQTQPLELQRAATEDGDLDDDEEKKKDPVQGLSMQRVAGPDVDEDIPGEE
jgi:hypothetical protein